MAQLSIIAVILAGGAIACGIKAVKLKIELIRMEKEIGEHE